MDGQEGGVTLPDNKGNAAAVREGVVTGHKRTHTRARTHTHTRAHARTHTRTYAHTHAHAHAAALIRQHR